MIFLEIVSADFKFPVTITVEFFWISSIGGGGGGALSSEMISARSAFTDSFFSGLLQLIKIRLENINNKCLMNSFYEILRYQKLCLNALPTKYSHML